MTVQIVPLYLDRVNVMSVQSTTYKEEMTEIAPLSRGAARPQNRVCFVQA